jgi:uncharacterized protein with PIN domain
VERAADREHLIKLYVDADITPKLARALRAQGYDAISAHETGNAEASDVEHMAFAAAEQRALLTCNARDFTPLFEDYWFAGREHSGVIVSEQLEFGEMLRRTIALLERITAAEMRNNWRNLAEFAALS